MDESLTLRGIVHCSVTEEERHGQQARLEDGGASNCSSLHTFLDYFVFFFI